MGSKLDKTMLLSLFNAGSWNRNFKNNTTSKMSSTTFNYTGFIQLKFLVEMLQRDDQDGFTDRLMVVCPAEVCHLRTYKYLCLHTLLYICTECLRAYRVFAHAKGEEVLLYRFLDHALQVSGEMHDTLYNNKKRTATMKIDVEMSLKGLPICDAIK